MKVFKKVMPLVLAVVCVLSVGLFAACGDGNDYSEDIAKLQEQIDKLKEDNQTLKDTVTEQDTQIKNQQTLIENLQSGITTEPKIYKIGETFTYRWNGTDYFSITFETTKTVYNETYIKYNVTNIAIHAFRIPSFLQGIHIMENNRFQRINPIDSSVSIGDTKSTEVCILGGEIKAILGFPINEDLFAPYAILDLSTVA